jgi:hypothetical protein
MSSKEFSYLAETLVANFTTPVVLATNNNTVYEEARKFIGPKSTASLEKLYQVMGEDFNQEKVDELLKAFEPSKFVPRILEMLVCRNVDAVNYYVAQMLRRVFIQRPDTIKALEKENPVSMNIILQSGSIDEIILKVAEKKVQDLSHMGLVEIISFINEKLKLGFDSRSSAYQAAFEVYYARNILVHNGGIVNETYLQKTKRTDLKVGDPYLLTSIEFTLGTAALVALGYSLDKEFLSHFKLT